jgi:hypothetical protein
LDFPCSWIITTFHQAVFGRADPDVVYFVTMTIKSPLKDKDTRAIAAFSYKINGHVFFIRLSDLPEFGCPRPGAPV